MQAIQYITIDKSNWQPGPWQSEPDKLQWPDPSTGLPCLMVRGPHGGWCGYVGVPEGHRYFGVGYDDVPVEAHGGLTFADHCQKTDHESKGICHVPDEGEPDHVWWLGFDCAHAGDMSPGSDSRLPEHLRALISCPWNASGYEEYRDMDYVKAEVTKLAAQLASLCLPSPDKSSAL